MGVKRSIWFKSLATFLAFIIVIQLLPLSVLAENITQSSASDISNEQNMEVVGEVVDKRTEYQKTYELTDGTYYEITSSLPIHEKSGSEWVEPDISEDEPETTQEAEDYVKDLSENISESTNDEYGIAPASIDINESETSGSSSVSFRIVGDDASVSYNKLNKNTLLLAQFPVDMLKETVKTQSTLHCNIMVNAMSSRSSVNVYAYPVIKNIDIDSSDLTVNVSNGLDLDIMEDEVLDFAQVGNLADYSFDITSTYMKWEKGLSDNYGLAFSTSSSTGITVNQCYLVRQYKIFDTYDSDYTYHIVDMGRAGKVYINDYTNAVTLVRNELSIDNNVLPVEIIRYFDFGHAYSNPNPSGYASWWNYSSCVTEITEYNISWYTPNGNSIVFIPNTTKNEPGNYKYWIDVDGDGYELILDETQNRRLANSKIITPESLTYTFGEYGKVVSISDEYNNTIKIGYKGSDLTQTNIFYVEDNLGRRYYFNYGTININNSSYDILKSLSVEVYSEDSKEYEVIQMGNKNVEVFYEYTVLPNNKVALTKVTYPDGESVSYSYDNGQLSEIVDVDGRKLSLDYNYNGRNIYPCLTSYSEQVKNIDDDVIITDVNDPNYNEYLDKSSLTIDSHNCYERIFTDLSGNKETLKYTSNLKLKYYNNSDSTFYADYSKNPNGKEYLSQILSPENSTNLILNENFEDGDNYWTNDSGGIEEGTLSGQGFSLMQINGENDTRRIVYQEVEGSFKKGDIYVLGGWGKSNTPIPTSKYFWGIEVHTWDEDDSGNTMDNTIYSIAFDSTIDNEPQQILGAFVIPEDTDYLEVQLVYSHQSGYANFDEIQLYKSSEENVTFFDDTDSTSNVSTLSEESNNSDMQTITNDKGLTTAEVVSDGNKSMVTKYAYDDNYYLSSVTDSNNVTTGYSYDPYNGTLNSVTIGDKITSFSYTPVGALKEVTRAVSGLTDNVSNISASYTYSHDRITSVTHNGIKYNFTYNSFGNVKNVDLEVLNNDSLDYDLISYDYSLDSKQNLNSITYANGDVLSYTYDDNGNVTQISFKSSSDESSRLMYKYEYSNGEISKITDYDSDRVTEYSDNGYTIKEITYGEDGSEQYTEIYAYSVDENGIIHETINGNEYTITENASDFDENTNETTYSSVTQFSFEGVTANINSSSVSDYFGRIKSSELSLTAADTESDFSHSIENSYTYMDYTASYSDGTEEKSVAATTNLIDTFESEIVDNNGTNEEVSNVFTSSYEYDSVGRITHVYYSLNNSASELVSYYQYDESGQVVTDVDFQNDRVTKYAYDSGGNITSKTIYEGEDSFDFNADTDTLTLASTPTSTINYGYGYAGSDNAQNELAGFTDLLTSYNGQSINYNELGYPLNYYKAVSSDENTLLNFEWEGTLLKSATTSDGKQKYIYSYNQEGLRTNKEIYSLNDDGSWKLITAIDYFWNEDILTAFNLTFDITEDQGPFTISLKVLYDEYQSPIGVSIDTNAQQTASNENISTYSNSDGINISSSLLTTDDIWWFVKDGQGNVTEMYGEVSGKTLRCSYDSYGNRTIEIDGTFLGDLWDQIADNMQGDNAWLAPILILFGTIATAASLVVILNVDQSTFKGYIYDNETGLYYCQNRYYSPSWGRFISMDDPAELTQNMEEPLNANLYTYCYNDPVNNIDPNGLSTYSLTGVGLQAEMSQNLLSIGGDVGIEMVYVPTKDELYTYYYYSSDAGTGYMNKAINYLNNALNNISTNSNISLKNLANLLKLNYSISLGVFGTYTNKSFSWPYSYTGMANSNQVMIGKWNGYQSTSPGCKAYGIYYSPVANSGSAFLKTSVMYQKIEFDSSAIKSYLSAQQNNIKNAIS